MMSDLGWFVLPPLKSILCFGAKLANRICRNDFSQSSERSKFTDSTSFAPPTRQRVTPFNCQLSGATWSLRTSATLTLLERNIEIITYFRWIQRFAMAPITTKAAVPLTTQIRTLWVCLHFVL